MIQKLAEALEHISEKHIAEAAGVKKRHRRVWVSAVAAVLIVALLFNMPHIPMFINAKAVSTASGSQAYPRPDIDDYRDNEMDHWRAEYAIYDAEQEQRELDAEAALTSLAPFFAESTEAYMAGTTENRVWSPVNAYIALAMLAEVTAGESRQQVLELLNTSDLDTLRTQVGAIWESVYQNDGNEISMLANSLWLDEHLDYDQETMDTLANYHYASVYQTDLGSDRAGKALGAWLNNNTGGLLKNYTWNAAFPEDALMTLASTVYLQAKWGDEFSSARNTIDVFHAPGGETEVTYMNKKELETDYYWFDSCGAISLGLKNGTRMWLILPDADKTVDDVLNEGQFWDLLPPSDEEKENSKYMKVNLSVPKFDISSGADLKSMLQELGITEVFDMDTADFTAITSDSPVYLTAINQAARVIIDEQGVKAASYIELPGAGAAMPPEEIIDFILDRPFLFVIADYSGIPLFTGVVNDPS